MLLQKCKIFKIYQISYQELDLFLINFRISKSISLSISKFIDSLFIEPAMTNKERLLFYKYLDHSNTFFEFGSGGSTYQAAKRNIKIFSVESDIAWHHKIQEDIANFTKLINDIYVKNKIEMYFQPNITYLTVDLHVHKNGWGYPGKDTNYSDWIKYSKAYNHSKYNADLILIDGRFRVACGLNVFKEISNKVLIYFHDFWNRPYYHILLDYYVVIDTADTSVVLKKKKNSPVLTDQLMYKYENILSLFLL